MGKKQKIGSLTFESCINETDLKKVYNYDVDVFAEASDFVWSLKSLKSEQKKGWSIYSVTSSEANNEIVAALFIKEGEKELMTKNTAIKMAHQGKGVSHQIKQFFEKQAKTSKMKNIVHFCAVDNFRTIALNESHGYKKVDVLKNGEIIKWQKPV